MSSSLRRLLVAALVATLPTTSAAQGAPAAPRIPPGTYQVVPDQNFSGGMDVSAFTLRFDGDSILVVEQQGMMMSRSRMTYEGEHLTWTDLEGQIACPGVAKYTFVLSDNNSKLRLSPVDDACSQRAAIIAQISLVRKE